ncbi:hypothetical protein [Nostoc sp. ChiQUE01b]|uniref:hypothetical protein n=1 Tax=Nostoc sp. ChiQUE01b TaxID=3075376 RepID=UPI002AD4C170|nr:hypothetical protein [Nostoc sp. ChiQUE01b]MDZ8262117.1 hypothetical protein [Nostoc sp. ChiQUE01b]
MNGSFVTPVPQWIGFLEGNFERVFLAGGGGIEAGMVQAGIRPAIAVEFDPSKPELSQAITKTHHRNFSEYGCRVVQLTVQEERGIHRFSPPPRLSPRLPGVCQLQSSPHS